MVETPVNETRLAGFNINRLPPDLQRQLIEVYQSEQLENALDPNHIYHGDARQLFPKIQPNSIALSIWSPPYFVGKEYEADLSFEDWQNLLATD